jgi:hypothetical protein
MKFPEELTNEQEFTNEILKLILAIILIHIHWIILLGFIAYLIYETGEKWGSSGSLRVFLLPGACVKPDIPTAEGAA